MPFAGFENFADCVKKVKAKTIEGKRKICGSLQAKHEKKLEIEDIKMKIFEERKEIEEIKKELEKTKEKYDNYR